MKPWQTAVRYGAIVFAVILIFNIIGWGLRLLGFAIGVSSSGTYDEAKVYEFDTDTDRIDIDLSAANLTVRFAKNDKVTVKSYLRGLTVKESFGKLKIKDNNTRFSSDQINSWVEITIPEGMILRELDLDLGAGKTLLSSINAEVVDIDGGAGELLIRRCNIADFDLDMGVGKLDFQGRITDKADISLGVGESEFIFLGDRDDYRITVDRGIGSISVEGEDFKGGTVGNGDIRVDIDGGVGRINVRFLSENE